MKAKLTFLGTGTSSGVPMVGCDCKVCRSADPKDSRLRASAYVEYGALSILVDCGPDFRQQALRAGIRHLDAILLTHNHMDHTGGLDDTRALNLCEGHPVNIYCEPYVRKSLENTYAYAFAQPRYPGSPEWHVHEIGNTPFQVKSNDAEELIWWKSGVGYQHKPAPEGVIAKSVEIVPIQGWHIKDKSISVLGYRFGNIAYLTDMSLLEDDQLDKLQGLDAVTLNCVKVQAHRSHFALQECLELFEKIGAKQSYITHISHLLPCHRDFEEMLPENVHAAYDGLVLQAE